MISLSIISAFLSIWCLYAISERTDLIKKGITLFISKNKTVAKIMAFAFFVTSTFFLVSALGEVTGIFTSICLWSTMASLVVLFTPLLVKKIYLLLVIIMVTGLEFIHFFTI